MAIFITIFKCANWFTSQIYSDSRSIKHCSSQGRDLNLPHMSILWLLTKLSHTDHSFKQAGFIFVKTYKIPALKVGNKTTKRLSKSQITPLPLISTAAQYESKEIDLSYCPYIMSQRLDHVSIEYNTTHYSCYLYTSKNKQLQKNSSIMPVPFFTGPASNPQSAATTGTKNNTLYIHHSAATWGIWPAKLTAISRWGRWFILKSWHEYQPCSESNSIFPSPLFGALFSHSRELLN